MLVLLVPIFISCKKKEARVELPQNISISETDNEPVLKVYDVNTKQIKEVGLETYLEGVLAGEIFNSWPIEALKAQAILARTYTLYFLQNLSSKYDGADISNDISEAQAYDESKINDNIKKAVRETKGLVVTHNGNLIEAWFHSNSGGKTITANYGLSYLGEETYTKSADSPENEENSENYLWTTTLTKSEILSALRQMGAKIDTISSFEVGERDESNRALTLKIGSSEVSANTFRIKVGSTKMKSTMIEDIVVSTNSVSISGKGYGHGVGMSQWGAKIMAEEGKTAEDIIKHYFQDVDVCVSNYATK